MKKILIVSLLTLMISGCSNLTTIEHLPVPGDYDFIGPLENTELID